ncbi:hypothetical protein VMT65_05990 [Nocardia sp. CDC153]|uniref:hypothetical protein n=1 Tax=Nocardia sp. CDC153 TaxID=3112167 RepID=UPI002DBF9DC5|nr:hypothetical protein [Nocardia sp. CDC153]MEC3952576.1 hypothetical protein [Nocardia sp. CDC153]
MTPEPPPLLVNPPCWLIFGLPWPDSATDFAESAIAVAPSSVPRNVVSQAGADVLDLATAIARDNGYRVIFLSDVTKWLDAQQQRTWADLGIDSEDVSLELTETPILQLYMTLSQLGHALICDASRQGLTVHTPNGAWQTGPREREDLRSHLTISLQRDWPPYATDVYRNQLRTR